MSAEVAPGVHRLGSELVNWYVVEADDGLVAVDAGLPRHADLMVEQLRALGRRPEDVRAVVLTHAHSDHTGVAGRLRDAGARVLVHAEDAALAAKPRPQKTDGSFLRALATSASARRFFWGMARGGGARGTPLPDVETFADGDELDVPGHPRAIHTPGHTAGHTAIHFPGHGALMVGDLMCTWHFVTARRGPQTMPRATNVDTRRSRESLARIEGLEASVVLPGHGDPFRGSPADAVAAARAVEPV
ncbi:MAG: MBL fold metallo-hydrolase [Actinomycetota bacterium]|nr:MBL fold metallo-hydrolase [Actinomycetota bacterium]